MSNVKLIIVGIAVLVGVFVFSQNQKTYDPINFNGEMYYYVDATETNNVVNHFFTPNGEDASFSDKFLQITDYSHPDLTERHVKILRQQLSATMALKPIATGSNRFFGMFRKKHPLYAIEKNNMFIIHSIAKSFEGDEEYLRARANKLIDKMDKISIAL